MNDSLDSRQLRALTLLAKTGSVTKTAKQLCVTHSAISHSLRKLEEQVGCRLFSKLGKKVTLSEAGEALLVHAERVLSEMRQARVTLTELNRWGSRRLRLGVESIFPPDFLGPVLLRFRHEFPQLVIHVEMCGHGQAANLLENRAVDLALSARPAIENGFEFLPLFADRFHLVVHADHPLAAKKQVTHRELTGQSCILLRGCGHERKTLEKFLLQQDVSLDISGEVENLEAVKSFVKLTRVMSFLPGWAIAPELKSRSFISLQLGRKPVEQSWGLVHLHSRPLNHAESTLLKLVRQQVEHLV